MPRWSVVAFVTAICGLTAACGEPGAFTDTGAYEQRAREWLMTQPPGAKLSDFPLVDGTYKGVAEPVTAQDPACSGARAGIITIGDRRLIFPYQPHVTFVVPIQPDGTFSTFSAPSPAPRNARARASARVRARADAPFVPATGSLDGRVGAGALEFTVRTPGCETRYRLRWVM